MLSVVGLVSGIMLLKLCSYNPQYACLDKLFDIQDELKDYHVIGLQGTGYKASRDSVCYNNLGKFGCYQWGHRAVNSNGSNNKSCGVAILLDQKLFQYIP